MCRDLFVGVSDPCVGTCVCVGVCVGATEEEEEEPTVGVIHV